MIKNIYDCGQGIISDSYKNSHARNPYESRSMRASWPNACSAQRGKPVGHLLSKRARPTSAERSIGVALYIKEMMLMHRPLRSTVCATGLLAVVSGGVMAQTTPAPTMAPAAAPVAVSPTAAPVAPAADLGFFGRFYKAYADEWGQPPASDPNAPAGNRPAPYPPQPQTSPPMPFTVWPFGGANPVGATIPSSIDSPLMTALAPTGFGEFLNDWHTQIYGWINPGFNVSTSSRSTRAATSRRPMPMIRTRSGSIRPSCCSSGCQTPFSRTTSTGASASPRSTARPTAIRPPWASPAISYSTRTSRPAGTFR
jgi:hypothetical protein